MTSPWNGACPAPFLDESLFPRSGGFVPGRACAPNPLEGANATTNCCIPCPIFDYLYTDDFKAMADGAAWVHVAGFILCGFLLLSMAVLPAAATRRSFLNIVLLVGIILLELGFIIPLARQPAQCHNAITPADMKTSTVCAFSGAFAAFGGMTLVTWILIRAFFMHLQICWDVTPTRYHFAAANVAAWTVTAALTAAVLARAGVSFRFGGYCHVNHTGSIPTYWAWLLAFGGLALLLQLATFAYCVKIYLQAALLLRGGGGSSAGSVPTTDNSAGGSSQQQQQQQQQQQKQRSSKTARAAARRVRQVLQLQWRSLAIVALAIFTTAFVCVVFIVLDRRQEAVALSDAEALVPWIACMILTRDNNGCAALTGRLIIPEPVAVATLFVLALVGVEAFFLLCRVAVLGAWREVVRTGWGGAGAGASGRGRRWFGLRTRRRRRDGGLMGGPQPSEFDLVQARNVRLGSAATAGGGSAVSPTTTTTTTAQRAPVESRRVGLSGVEKAAERKESAATTEAPHAL